MVQGVKRLTALNLYAALTPAPVVASFLLGSPSSRYSQGVLRSLSAATLLLLVVAGCAPGQGDSLPGNAPEVSEPPAPVVPQEPEPQPEPQPEPEEPVFDAALYSIDEADSLWVVVNKARPLDPIDYAPDDVVTPDIPAAFPALMRQAATDALEAMYEEAVANGVGFRIQSSYRSFSVQKRVKADHVARFGQEVSDRRSARAGHSEHQTGLAVDLTTASGQCSINVCFADTPEGAWLADNAWRYGFIIRYVEGKTDITGYVFEPWHFRFVGKELAEELWRLGNPTLEEFFGLEPAPDYTD